MKVKHEVIVPDEGSSFRIIVTPRLYNTYMWHYHPEYEIVYVEGGNGARHVGEHISGYQHSDLVFIGPYIPHLNFDYGVRTECEQVVVQMKQNFLGADFFDVPEFASIKELFDKAKFGLSFSGETKEMVSAKLKRLPALSRFEQLLELLHIFQLLATSTEVLVLNHRPAMNMSFAKDQERMEVIYKYIDEHYHELPDVNAVARQVYLTTPAFCRFFKKNTHNTFTDFVNRYRINQARHFLLQNKSISEACYAVGFQNLSYFNKLFNRLTGENPSAFKKRHLSG